MWWAVSYVIGCWFRNGVLRNLLITVMYTAQTTECRTVNCRHSLTTWWITVAKSNMFHRVQNTCAHVTTCAEVHQPQDDSPYHKESLPAAVNSTSRSSSNKHCLSKSPQVDDGETAQELPRHDGLQLENSNNVSSNCSPESNVVVG
jgi:hypothetical protein